MRTRTVTGLAFDTGGTLRAVEVASSLRGPTLVRVARFNGPPFDPSSAALTLGRALEEGFAQGATVLGVPSHLVFHRTLSFPFRGRAKVAAVLAPALEGEIPLSPSESLLDHIPLPSARGSSALAVACPRGTLSPLLPLLSHPPRVQTDALGLAAGARALGFTDGAALLAEGDGVVAVALSKGRIADLRRLRTTDPSALADQTAAAVKEMGGGGEVLLAGSASARLPLRALLRGRGIETLLEPEGAPLLREAGEDPLEYLPAVGLALAGVGRGVEFDLAREGRERPGWEWTPDRVRLAVLAGLVLLLGVGLAVTDHIAVRSENRFWQAHLRQSFAELFPASNPGKGTELSRLKAELEVLRVRLGDLTSGSREETEMLGVMAALSRTVPPEMDLKVDELSIDPGRMRLDGSLSSFEAIDRLKALLEQSPHFESVKVQNARVGAKADRVNFRVQAEVP